MRDGGALCLWPRVQALEATMGDTNTGLLTSSGTPNEPVRVPFPADVDEDSQLTLFRAILVRVMRAPRMRVP